MDSEIRRAARTIRLELPGLLPGDAGPVGALIDGLFARARSGHEVDDELMELLSQFEPTRRRLDQLLPDDRGVKGYEDAQTGGYAGLPGHGEPIAPLVYRCPKGDYEYPALEVGEEIPLCPVHNIALLAGA